MIYIKLSDDSRNFLNSVNSTFGKDKDALLLALSKAISNKLVLPTSPVNDIEEYYLMSNLESVRKIIGAINEICVLDIESTQQLIKDFWVMRYKVAHGNNYLLAANTPHGVLASFMGFADATGFNVIDTIANSGNAIINYLYNFNKVISEIVNSSGQQLCLD